MHRSDWMVWSKEAQRRAERRAEARLAYGLQRLDEAKHYHLSTLAREQHMLQRHLLAIKTGSRWRGRNTVGLQSSNLELSHPPVSYTKMLLPIIPLAGGEPDRHRSAKPYSSRSLQDRVQDFISSGENRAESSTAQLCLPCLKLPTNTLPPDVPQRESRDREPVRLRVASHGERERETQRPLWETVRGRHKDGHRENELTAAHARDREKAEDRDRVVSSSTPLSPLSELSAPDGHPRTVHTLPDFAQAMTEARKSRYIRHRGQPLSERELSIKEIFSRTSIDINATH
ncbi:uncharacterized protein LOC113591627 [Electrophorus electricus]|uniref:uncharacterized protein LOC113591627 n=1 Tax=Electrophorus electricus TaxID=8005 RepID=UPI0015D069A0|nr:uncharacterized protein LOC113591627 [Electrophorus electricus]XP_035380477.1 uncharacterized protein LOC113591627 [Electrophorus electricus]